MTETFRLRYVNQIVGAVVLLFLIGLLLFMLLLLHQKDVFTQRYNYDLQIDQSQLGGLRPGMDVRILGETAGTITRVEYADGNGSGISVRFEVKNLAKYAVLENSKVVVARTFGVGEPYLEVQRGRDVLGLIVTNLTEAEAAAVNSLGVRVSRVLPEGPSANMIQQNDIVQMINGRDVNGIKSYYERMSELGVGMPVQLRVIRSGQRTIVNPIISRMVVHARLQPGTTIYQFQPDEDKLQRLASDVGRVQESIQTVEQTFTSGVENSIVPSMNEVGEASIAVEATVTGLDPPFRASLKGIDDATSEIIIGIERISTSFNTFIDPAFQDVTTAAEKLGRSLDAITPKTTNTLGNIDVSLGHLEQTLASSQTAIDSLAPQATDALTKIEAAASSLQQTLERTQPILESIESETSQLPGTVARANNVMNSTQTVLDGLSNHWLLRRSVKRSQQKKSRGASQRSSPMRIRRPKRR